MYKKCFKTFLNVLRLLEKFFMFKRRLIKNLNTWNVNSHFRISKFTEGKWRLELCLVFILWISGFIKNWSLLLTTNISREHMYCELSGKIFSFLNKILQESLFPQPIIILITLFCIQKTCILCQEFLQTVIL